MPDVEIVDRHGRRRRARPGEVLADGERFALPMQFMDHAAYGFRSHFSDVSVDYTDPHKPGPRLDVGDAARLAADPDARAVHGVGPSPFILKASSTSSFAFSNGMMRA